MNIVVEVRHMAVTDAMKQYVQTKAAKLSKYYSDVQTIEVILDIEADKPSVEMVASAKRKNVFVASHREDDMYACVDRCLHKITEQLRRHKDRVRNRHKPSHGGQATTDSQ